MNMKKFEVKLKHRPVYRMGEDVRVTLEIKNNMNREVCILKRSKTLDCHIRDCFYITYKNNKVEYDGKIVKRLAYTDEDYILLQAGETLKIQVDISENYFLSKPGLYTIQFDQDIMFKRELDLGFSESVHRERLTHKKCHFIMIGKSKNR